jgi:hypothetical protein
MNYLTEKVRLEAGESCPHCMGGILEKRQHRFSSDRGPNLPDADWLACDECDFATDPE